MNITKITNQGVDTDAWEISYAYDLEDRITHVEDCLGPIFTYDYKISSGGIITAEDIEAYRKYNRLTWHEKNDLVHMDLVLSDVNDI